MHKLNKAVAKAEARESARSETTSVRDASVSIPTRNAPGVSLSAIDDMLKSGKEKVLTKKEPAAANFTEDVVVKGELHKKSGGKHDASTKSRLGARSNWRKRFFVLSGSVLQYYKHEAAYDSGKTELGRLDVRGCTLFLKEVSHGVYRFTVAAADRELKLRAPDEAEYQRWVSAVRPLAATFRELESQGLDELELEDAVDDDEMDAEEEAFLAGLGGRARAATAAPATRGRSVTNAPGPGVQHTLSTGDVEGWLEKKQGGKEGKSSMLGAALLSWDKRYFVLRHPPDGGAALRYYKSPSDYLAGREALGSVACSDAVVFVKDSPKDAAKGHFRFTIKDVARELKLRAASQADCVQWVDALTRPGRARFEGTFAADSERFRSDTVLDVSDAAEGGYGGRPSAPPPVSAVMAPPAVPAEPPRPKKAADATAVDAALAAFAGEDSPASASASDGTQPALAVPPPVPPAPRPLKKGKSALAVLDAASGKH